MTFKELGLGEASLKAVEKLGFSTPTTIQERAIPRLLEETRDLIALSQTGTGKTAAFGLPILEKIDTASRKTQSLIIAPTRELCRQITADMESYGHYIPGLTITPVYGGADMNRQIRALKNGTHVIVATPGRLLDLIRRSIADISGIRYLVLDEADIMLDMGFKDDLDAILSTAPAERTSVLLSATMPGGVTELARNYMKDAEEITIGKKNTAAENVDHKHFIVDRRDKYQALKRIIDYNTDIYGIVFCRTRRDTQEIADKLLSDGYDAEALHGDLSQAQREFVMRKFRDKNVKLLIATDIAARGLDVIGLTHIIHYQLPEKTEIYTHRSGRTGRAGKSGESLALVERKERYRLKRIEKVINSSIDERTLPKGGDICERRLRSIMNVLKKTPVDEQMMKDFSHLIEEEFAGVSKEELASRFLSLQAGRILEYYRSAPEQSAPRKRDPERKPRTVPKSDSRGYSRREAPSSGRPRQRDPRRSNFIYLKINLGKKDKLLPPQLIGLVNQSTRNRSITIGNIDIGARDSRFQVEENAAGQVADALNNFTYNNRKVSVGFHTSN